MAKNNFDHNVIDNFGNEWESYDQSSKEYNLFMNNDIKY